MHADFTRWTFDPTRGYRAVLLQQGRLLLDADVNEQAEIVRHHDEARSRHTVGPVGGPVHGAGFAITDAAGDAPSAPVPWADLRVSTGVYYVDGVLCETGDRAGGGGWPLRDQRYLRAIGASPGLAEPADNGRYTAYLDVWSHLVTADQEPALRESALGGPDTTVRARTVWQVRLARLTGGEECSDLHAAGPGPAAGTMAVSLQDAETDADPCRITTTGGYQLLENQLYRVQIHDGTATPVRFLWSRENGSVVARLLDITSTDVPDMDAELVVDRVGKDEELSIRAGHWVEVTSEDRELRGEPGYLAEVGAPHGLAYPIAWDGDPPASVAALGRNPLVRRWDGPPQAADTDAALEGGISVHFVLGGRYITGDYWLFPARTVRQGYGVTALGGTVEWPTGGDGRPLPVPPHGPVRRRTPLAILVRSADGWSRESDCRRLFPTLTELVSVDLLGGDGQEALPGSGLDEPVRVAVRNGGLPVPGVTVRFVTAREGRLAMGDPPDFTTPAVPDGPDRVRLDVTTDDNGIAEVRWLLDAQGPVTQVLTAGLVDDHDHADEPPVRVTARLSIADQVAWQPPCDDLDDARTVQDGLDRLATARTLHLLGGDGQHLGRAERVLPQPITVRVDSACGSGNAEVFADVTEQGALVAVVDPGEPTPTTLDGRGDTGISTRPGPGGVAAFWWQPAFGADRSEILRVGLVDQEDTWLRVTAQRLPETDRRTPGVHITRLRVRGGQEEFLNDSDVPVERLAQGIEVNLDGPVVQDTVRGKPVVRVLLELPWPMGPTDGEVWFPEGPIATRTIELEALWNADGPLIVWGPSQRTREWLVVRLMEVLKAANLELRVLGRFVIDGWAIVSQKDPQLHLNGHPHAVFQNGRTIYKLPTDDEIAGGQFVQWFHLVP